MVEQAYLKKGCYSCPHSASLCPDVVRINYGFTLGNSTYVDCTAYHAIEKSRNKGATIHNFKRKSERIIKDLRSSFVARS